MLSGQLKDALEGVNGEDEEERGKWVSLPKTPSMLDRQAGDPVEKDPRRGGAKQSGDPISSGNPCLLKSSIMNSRLMESKAW
jgi:hypothetical protein